MGRFNRISLGLAGVLCATAGTVFAQQSTDLLARTHFVGSTVIFASTNSATLKRIADVDISKEFRNVLLDRLSHAPGQLLGRPQGPDESAIIKPLFQDLLAAESYSELHGGANVEFTLAVQLNDERAAIWNSQLEKAFASWTGEKTSPAQLRKFSGWQINRVSSPKAIRFIRADKWVVLGIGEKALPVQEAMIAAIEKSGSPSKFESTSWFEATVDWPKLQQWIPLNNAAFKLARTDVTISPRGGDLRTVIQAVYSQNLNWKPQPWLIPTNLVRDPIVSFTAGQRLDAFVNEPAWLRQLTVHPLATQLFIWANSTAPFHSFAAVSVNNAKQVLDKLATELPSKFNPSLEQRKGGKLVWDGKRNQIVWQGLQVALPQLSATNGYLFAALFPPLPLKTPLPEQLLSQIEGRTNLVFYDWEYSRERMVHWHMLRQILPPFAPTPAEAAALATGAKTDAERAAQRLRYIDRLWQSAIAQYLGNSATEITVTAPNQLTLVRKSTVGLTAFELTVVTKAIKDPAFPLFGWRLPIQPSSKK